MNLNDIRQRALGALAVSLVAGGAIVFAATVSAASPPASPAAAASDAPESARADTDTLQQGDQTTPDGAAEVAAPETEASTAEEPGDPALSGGGHADDPNAPNANHEFDGVE